jgi:hypothetical protein
MVELFLPVNLTLATANILYSNKILLQPQEEHFICQVSSFNRTQHFFTINVSPNKIKK